MNAEWFAMPELKRHTYNNKIWIPLYAQHRISETGEVGHEGFREEYFGAHSLIVPNDQKRKALTLEWMDLNFGSSHKPWVDEKNSFHSGLEYESRAVRGIHPILLQYFEIEQSNDIHINQDIVLGLGLKRVGDVWICPEEDYVEVIKVQRNETGKPIRAEIKAEFLKDYLCAADSGLLILTYQSRQNILENFTDLRWKEDEEIEEKTETFRWSERLIPIHEGYFPFNQSVHVLHSGRTDTDYSEDVPVYGFPTDETSYSKSYVIKPTGRRLLHAIGEIWKKEWITPAVKSPRVKSDRVVSTLEFIVDNEGRTETSDTLIGQPSRWLWFHPNVINDLLNRRTALLSWHTENTGSVGGAWNRAVHFGVNSLGMINVYAKDIGQTPEIDKKTWARHNVSPDGGVCAELLMSQMQAIPAETVAPEERFLSLVNEINKSCKTKLAGELFREHSLDEEISKRIHRFRATSLEGFFGLCKEITRFVIERMDMDFLKQVKPEKEKLGSLKRLERILNTLGYDGRTILAPLAGVYELRIADAHLPSTTAIAEAMRLVALDFNESKLNSGKKVIVSVNDCLAQINIAFDNGDYSQLNRT